MRQHKIPSYQRIYRHLVRLNSGPPKECVRDEVHCRHLGGDAAELLRDRGGQLRARGLIAPQAQLRLKVGIRDFRGCLRLRIDACWDA